MTARSVTRNASLRVWIIHDVIALTVLLCDAELYNKPVIALHNSGINRHKWPRESRLPSNSLGLRPLPLLGQLDFPAVIYVG